MSELLIKVLHVYTLMDIFHIVCVCVTMLVLEQTVEVLIWKFCCFVEMNCMNDYQQEISLLWKKYQN